jgi:putative transposase
MFLRICVVWMLPQTLARRFRRKNTRHALYMALQGAERKRVGRLAGPSAAVMDCQGVKTVKEPHGIRGHDVQQRVKGRKRHLLVDTLGWPIAWYVTPADLSDSRGARRLPGSRSSCRRSRRSV